MRTGRPLPDGQAEVVFNDVFVEYLETLTVAQRESVLVDIAALCTHPVGTHPLSNRNESDRLAGWNTVEVLGREHRVVFGTRIENGVGVIEVLCGGPRRGGAVYDMANLLIATGRLTDDEVAQIWEAIELLDVVAEEVGLDGWDYRPPGAPPGMIKAVVAAGLLPLHLASAMSQDELEAAMEAGWTNDGPDPSLALAAAMRRARAGMDGVDMTRILVGRLDDRCDAILPRAGVRCIRKAGHPGPHRSKV
jgi:hypothetical protein